MWLSISIDRAMKTNSNSPGNAYICLLLVLTLVTSCDIFDRLDDEDVDTPKGNLQLIANSPDQWTGVAVSSDTRIFVNYPNWSEGLKFSVAEVNDSASVSPFPNDEWNAWAEGKDPASHFICVQSVFVDKNDFLWVLDPANPQRKGEYLGVVPGGAKLVKIDLSNNTVIKVISFSEPIIEKTSYLNDIRIDEEKQIGYITDSNEGALVVVDLNSGNAKRFLAQDPTTKSENKVLIVEGKEVRNEQGELVNFHSDGIALNPMRTYLYWRPINGVSLYRLSTSLLNDPNVSDSTLSKNVQRVGIFPPSDGLIFGKDGRLYLTSIEENAVRSLEEGGNFAPLVVKCKDLKWPDSFAVGPDGMIYVTTSQIHIKNPTEPYRIYKFDPQ
jgi:hypothetical protein